MPVRPMRPCSIPGCPELSSGSACPRHRRPSTQHLYGSQRWREASRRFLAGKACVDCGAAATVTDHEQPHRGDLRLFWDETNWSARCKPCHDRKTVQQDGGFGNPVQGMSHAERTPVERGFGL